MRTLFIPSIVTQNNVNMSQSVPFVPFAPSVNISPFIDETTYLEQSVLNAANTALSAVPTMHPITANSMSTTIETYNAANLEPWTYMNYAQAPYGNARGQVSLITDLGLNKPKPLLPVNNKDMFRQVDVDKRHVSIPVSRR